MQSSIVAKSMTVLDVLGESNRPRTFTEIVKATGFNKSTVHRLLSILAHEGLAVYDPDGRTYFLGPRLLRLARHARRGLAIETIAFDEMVQLHAKVREGVTVGVLKGKDVAFLRIIDPDHDWGIIQPPGAREPVHSTATGKALLAFLPAETRSGWLDRHELTRFTERTITSRERFEKELEEVRINGYATSDRENVEYVNGIAVPIFNYVGEPVAALNIWAPAFRCPLPDLLKWTDELKATALRISQKLVGAEAGT